MGVAKATLQLQMSASYFIPVNQILSTSIKYFKYQF